jgi:small subunit ribosomal protein S4
MARYTGPSCKLCRREGVKLYLKGSRCTSDKCAIVKRNFVPGQHGKGRKGFASDYQKQLREKQKAKRIYGLLEGQFRRYYAEASRVQGITGQVLLQMLEARLDNVLYQAGMASSRAHARKMIGANKVTVNGKKVNIPSFGVSSKDIIKVAGIESTPSETIPEWLTWNGKDSSIVLERLPEREEIKSELNEQLIVEYYSR